MVTVKALYDEPIESVTELWRNTSKNLGLTQTGEYPQPNRGCWTTFRLRSTALFFGVCEAFNGKVWADLLSYGFGYLRHEEVFRKILQHHQTCTEAAVVDDDPDCSGPMLGFVERDINPHELLSGLLVNYRSGTRQLRSFRTDTLNDPDLWLRSAHKLGLKATISDNYLLVDVHWEERGRRVPRRAWAISL